MPPPWLDLGEGTSLWEEKALVVIASNESLAAWIKTFTDPRLCTAIVDCITLGGNIIKSGTDSCRIAQTCART